MDLDAPFARGTRSVPVCRLRLSIHGSGTTSAARNTPRPARISFFLRKIKSVRSGEQSNFELLATLDGQLTLAGPDVQPVFLVGPGPSALQQPQADPNSPLALRLAFDSEWFSGTDGVGEARLVLPADTNDFNYLELDSQLEVGGAIEADLGVSDPCDVPLPIPQPDRFEVELIDDLDNRLANVQVSFTTDAGTTSTTTDADGVAFVEHVSSLNVRVAVSSASLQQALSGRTPDQQRTTTFTDDEDALFVTPGQLQSGVPLSGPSQRIVVVVGARLVHGARATGWDGVRPKQPGPYSVAQDVLTVVSMLADGSGAALVLEKLLDDKATLATWLSSSPEALAVLLCSRNFAAVWPLLGAIPLAPPTPSPTFSPEQNSVTLTEPVSPGPDDVAEVASRA